MKQYFEILEIINMKVKEENWMNFDRNYSACIHDLGCIACKLIKIRIKIRNNLWILEQNTHTNTHIETTKLLRISKEKYTKTKSEHWSHIHLFSEESITIMKEFEFLEKKKIKTKKKK